MVSRALVTALGVTFGCAPLVAQTPAPQPDPALIEGVTINAGADGLTVRLDLSHPRQPEFHELDPPYRVFFDFADTRLKSQVTLNHDINHPLCRVVRVGQYLEEPPVARLVLEVTSKMAVKIATADDGKTIFFGLGNGAGRPEPAPQVMPAVEVGRTGWVAEAEREAIYQIMLSSMAQVRSFYLQEPDRVVIDIDDAGLQTTPSQPGDGNGLVKSVRMSQFSPDVVRCVLDLKQVAGHAVLKRLNPARLEIKLALGETKQRHVVVDPGHGGKDPGCSGYRAGLKEKDVVLDIGRRAATLLRSKGIDVTMTRSDDTFIELEQRPAIANRLRADLFVSIHCNAMPDSKKGQRSGSEVYYYTEQSSTFAQVMLHAFAEAVGLPGRGTYQRRFVVVRQAVMPSVLVETGYLDHAGDGKQLDSPEFRQRCALGVTHGVVQYLQRIPPRVEHVEEAG